MKRNTILLLGMLLLAAVTPTPSLAGAWGKPAGKLFFSPKLYSYQATRYWDNGGQLRDIGSLYDKKELNLYLEYGLAGGRTLLLQTAYDRIISGGSRVEGQGDTELGLIQVFRRDGPQVISGKLLLIVPGGYPADRAPLIGYGKYGAEAGLLFGRSFGKYYLDSGLSYRYYDGYPSDQLRANLVLGSDSSQKLAARAELSAILGLENGQPYVINELIIPPDYRLLQADLSLILNLRPGLALLLGLSQALLGRDTGVGTNLYFGCELTN